jgi:DNA-binding beta-propeller fold protein YncE
MEIGEIGAILCMETGYGNCFHDRGGAFAMKTIIGVAALVFLASCGMDASGESPDRWDAYYTDGAADSPWADSPADTAADGPLPPPEEEIEADFRVPKASGRYIYIANAAEDYVVVLDSTTLGLEVVTVGKKPTAMATEGLSNAAMVINSGSLNISLIETLPSVGSVVRNFPAVEGLNSLRVSPAGVGALAFHDFDLPLEEGEDPVQGQDVVAVILEEGREASVHRTCGYMPREVEYDETGRRGFLVTKEGISIADLDTMVDDEVPLPIILYDDHIPMEMHELEKDVDISPDGSFAVVRVEESPETFSTSVWVIDLETRTSEEIDLPGVPYDLDLAPDGSFAVAVLPTRSQMALIPLPVEEDPPSYTTRDVTGMYAGQSQISPDGSLVALFSNQSGEERVGVADLRAGTFDVIGLHKTVKTVAFTPDGGTLVVIHGREEGPAPDPTDYEQVVDHSFGYSLVRLADGTVKQQLTRANPEPFIIHPDGETIYLLQRDDALDVREVEVIDTGSFIVSTIGLGSPPVSIGYVPESNKMFVSQDHPSGRITFIDADGNIQTVTGFELNDWIVD